jgi:trk system potassium uptake protein
VLMGLALMGGGVATTAGGVKLLRVLAMARMGRAEMDRMIFPRMVDRGTDYDRFLAHDGARAAWLFAMVFAIVAVALIGVVMLQGEPLETALIYVVAALTTTGPLVQVAGDTALTWSSLGDAGRITLALTMILGRLEILVILALALGQIARD